MLTEIPPLLTLLLLVAFAPEGGGARPGLTVLGLTLLLIGIFFEAKFFKRQNSFLQQFVRVELLLFLFFAYYFLNLGSLGRGYATPSFSIALAIYFLGLTFATSLTESLKAALKQLRLNMPFIFPFLAFILLQDAYQRLAASHLENPAVIAITAVSFLALTALLLPKLLLICWGCTPLPSETPLSAHIEALCRRAGFSHGGLYLFQAMDNMPTAAISGVFPRFRYLLFTPSLLRKLSIEQVGAVAAHEIGHYQGKHLLLFPLLMLGSFILIGLIFHLLPFPPLVLALVILLVAVNYFYFVIGFFIRLFERQADLAVFKLGVPSHYLIEALDCIGQITTHGHQTASWHHDAIQERIDRIQAAEKNRSLISGHDRKVRCWLLVYLIFLFFCSGIIFLL